MENIFYVYVYKDLEGIPFYVGTGKGDRYIHHINKAINGDKSLKSEIIRNILDIGKEPVIEKVIENIDYELGFLIEEELISKYGRIVKNTGTLTNIQARGWVSPEARKNLSKANKKRIGCKNGFFGKHHSDSSKKKKSIKSIEASNKFKEENDGTHWNTGREITKETRDKLKIFRICPHCGREGRGSAMNRWHFDNCKQKKENKNAD